MFSYGWAHEEKTQGWPSYVLYRRVQSHKWNLGYDVMTRIILLEVSKRIGDEIERIHNQPTLNRGVDTQ